MGYVFITLMLAGLPRKAAKSDDDGISIQDSIPSTMSAKSLGTFPLIFAIDEVQNPSPLKQCCLKDI